MVVGVSGGGMSVDGGGDLDDLLQGGVLSGLIVDDSVDPN